MSHPLHSESIENILQRLPPEARLWAENLPWNQRRYVLSLCHLLCAASPATQAQFLDEYTANGLISKLIENHEIRQKVKLNLDRFRITTQLTETVLRNYIRQFYIHSAQDSRRKLDLILESAVRVVVSTEERNHIFNYILGFEIIKLLFRMSWLQHERLYRLQRNQEEFITLYLKPIQQTHRLNQIIVPRDEKLFFARRDYYVQVPTIADKKLIELAIATFTTEVISSFGFSVIRHPDAIVFDYDYVFGVDPEAAFP
ncbi:cobyrinic acid a,c-diamide synthase [Leptolyngbya sp. FACHB-17]|uniref:cobyrinic acid a,c-diamide synthase n=1 Tax=unclassified Leptolyngbya TaxID=2650499 RepID=UPI001680E49C|nr:cobyrinic acid a,c-diamide synthase [Leptolyngbya sp. FACHB-17]MBD2079195.1 cobyrinic acid a,c-diamide synthase [Leptolyngbya sp. FACHB-17]